MPSRAPSDGTAASRPERADAAARHPRTEARTRTALAEAGTHPRDIGQRLRVLEGEWDLDRALQAQAAALSLAGLALGLRRDRRFLALPALAAVLLLQQAVQGWCPPVPLLRRLGMRTASEIAEERTALKALRGDFAGFEEGAPAGHVLAAVRGVE